METTVRDTVDVSELTEDGDRIELPDGTTLVLSVGPDEWSDPIADMGEGWWSGRVEWSDRSRTTGYGRRPDGMTGRAEILTPDRFADLWWECPDDVVLRSDVWHALRREILDLLEYGYAIVTVSHLCAHGGVIDAASLGGVEPFADGGYIREIVAELVTELGFSSITGQEG